MKSQQNGSSTCSTTILCPHIGGHFFVCWKEQSTFFMRLVQKSPNVCTQSFLVMRRVLSENITLVFCQMIERCSLLRTAWCVCSSWQSIACISCSCGPDMRQQHAFSSCDRPLRQSRRHPHLDNEAHSHRSWDEGTLVAHLHRTSLTS